MKRKWMIGIGLVSLLALVACGGGDSGGTDTSGQPDTPGTNDPGSQGDPGTQTGNPHSYWPNADWDTVWPEEGETATYQGQLFGGAIVDIVAHMDYTPVDWKGGSWSRLIAGTPEPGKTGFVVYFDRSEPWNPKAKGVEVYSETTTDGPSMVEWFDDPLAIGMDKPEGSKETVSTQISGDYGGFSDTMGVNYEYNIVSYDASVDVPYGTVDGCMHIQIILSGELIGTGTITVDTWLHPEQFFVKLTDAPGFAILELKEAWK